jgi:tetratricopeptide (TPR) repeat protein
MKVLLTILAIMIFIPGFSQVAANHSNNAKDYFISAAEASEAEDYTSAVADLAKTIIIDSSYVKANFHWKEERFYKTGIHVDDIWVEITRTVEISVFNPKPDVNRLRKNSKMLYKEYRKTLENYEKALKIDPANREVYKMHAQALVLEDKHKEAERSIRYLRKEIKLDLTSPALTNINKLYYARFNKMQKKENFSNKSHSGYAIHGGAAFDSPEEYSMTGRQFNILLKGKEFRDALMKDYDDLVRQQKSEIEQLDIIK